MVEIISTWTGNRYPVEISAPTRGTSVRTYWPYVVTGTVQSKRKAYSFVGTALDPFEAVANALANARTKILATERYHASLRGVRKVTHRDFTLVGVRKALWPYAAYVGFRPPMHKLPPWEAAKQATI